MGYHRYRTKEPSSLSLPEDRSLSEAPATAPRVRRSRGFIPEGSHQVSPFQPFLEAALQTGLPTHSQDSLSNPTAESRGIDKPNRLENHGLSEVSLNRV